jgi:hypothetical protein
VKARRRSWPQFKKDTVGIGEVDLAGGTGLAVVEVGLEFLALFADGGYFLANSFGGVVAGGLVGGGDFGGVELVESGEVFCDVGVDTGDHFGKVAFGDATAFAVDGFEEAAVDGEEFASGEVEDVDEGIDRADGTLGRYVVVHAGGEQHELGSIESTNVLGLVGILEFLEDSARLPFSDSLAVSRGNSGISPPRCAPCAIWGTIPMPPDLGPPGARIPSTNHAHLTERKKNVPASNKKRGRPEMMNSVLAKSIT